MAAGLRPASFPKLCDRPTVQSIASESSSSHATRNAPFVTRSSADHASFKSCLERDGIRLNHHRTPDLCLSMISAQTRRVCREGKPLHTFPDHATRTCKKVQDRLIKYLI